MGIVTKLIPTGEDTVRLTSKALAAGLICASATVGGLATAKDGVVNEAVKARQAAMGTIAASAKVLGDMVKGAAPFDTATAAEAQAAMAATAATVPDLFRAEDGDPKSKAKPEIWANWSDFKTKADGLYQAAQALDPSTLDGVTAGMGAIGEACAACHKPYRL